MTTQLAIPENALSITETQPFTALTFTARTTLNDLSAYAPGIGQELFREASRLQLTITGPIQWIYTGATGDATQEFQLEIVLPVREQGEASPTFPYKEFPAFRCATYTHTGPWSDFPELYSALFGQFNRDGYQYNGQVREVYSTVDLENQANCVTEIQMGLA